MPSEGIEPPSISGRAPCTIPGCDRRSKARGWCHTHYKRWQRTGTPDADHPPRPYEWSPTVKLYAIPGRWVDRAACTGHQHLFVLPDERGRRDEWRVGKALTQQINRAKAICRTCPVADECRQWAMTEPDPATGLIAGGLTPIARRKLRKAAG